MSDLAKNETSETDLKRSVEWFRQAVSQIKALNILPCPKNYALWYEYYSERNIELCAELDRVLKNGDDFDDRLTDHLYHHFFINDAQEQLSEMRRAIRDILDELSSELSELGVGMGTYESALNECESQISEDMDVKTLHSLINSLLAETRNCRDANQNAMEYVSKSNEEIEAMRDALKRLNEEALEDALTGVANRRALDRELNDMLSNKELADNSCLLMLDIDRFKQVNDTYGHVVGDRVLKFVAAMIRRSVKGKDFVARFGGEEFAVILPETDYKGGIAIANNILAAVAKSRLTINKKGESIGRMTLSAGLCRVRSNDDIEELIAKADNLLYQAKASGRNTVIGEFDG